MSALTNRVPVLLVFREGGFFNRAFVDGDSFKRWRETLPDLTGRVPIDVYTYAGKMQFHIPIIITMNGFVYDKIVEYYTGRLLRPKRKEFFWDIAKCDRIE